MLGVKTIKPANERKAQYALSKIVIKQLKDSWINVKNLGSRSRRESLVPLLIDGLGVKIPYQSVLKDRSEVFIRIDYFTASLSIWIAP